MKILGIEEDHWTTLGGNFTAKEIAQQPDVWENIIKLFKSEQTIIKRDMETLLDEDLDIILTGAGTSEFVGRSVELSLRNLKLDARSIPTTDLLSNPEIYIKKNRKLLLISYARSGNSPESLAVVKVIKKILKDKLFTLTITCNKSGELAIKTQKWKKNYLFILPEATNDQGFAMTSSFTGMILWTLLLFYPVEIIEEEIKVLNKNIKDIKDNQIKSLIDLANLNHDRIVFIGSNHLNGFAQEAALKVLELSNGKVATFYNSALGFRHGPKSIIDQKTIIFHFLSNNKYTRLYDEDLIKEIKADNEADKIVIMDYKRNDKLKDFSDKYYCAKKNVKSIDIIIGLYYIYLAQIYAIHKSLFLKKTPDKPCPSGQVNRVVQGVKIHKLK